MNLQETFSIETIENTNNNGQIRYFQGNTCIIATCFGLQQTSLQRANEVGMLDVVVKMEQKNDMKLQRYYEMYTKQVLEPIINLEENPNKLIKIVLVIANDNGSILSAFINSAYIALIHNGISLKKTIFSQDLCFDQDQNVIFYPTLKQQQDQKQITIVYNINTIEVYSIQNQQGMNYGSIKKLCKRAEEQIPQIKNMLKSHVYQLIQSQPL